MLFLFEKFGRHLRGGALKFERESLEFYFYFKYRIYGQGVLEMSLWINLIGIACVGIFFSTVGIYLLIKPGKAITDGSGTEDSIIATIVIHVVLLFMTTKHLGAILLLVGIGLGVVMYIELYDTLLPHVKAMRMR